MYNKFEIMTLYDYLEVTSYQALIEQSEFVTDKEEIFRISALHLSFSITISLIFLVNSVITFLSYLTISIFLIS